MWKTALRVIGLLIALCFLLPAFGHPATILAGVLYFGWFFIVPVLYLSLPYLAGLYLIDALIRFARGTGPDGKLRRGMGGWMILAALIPAALVFFFIHLPGIRSAWC